MDKMIDQLRKVVPNDEVRKKLQDFDPLCAQIMVRACCSNYYIDLK